MRAGRSTVGSKGRLSSMLLTVVGSWGFVGCASEGTFPWDGVNQRN